MRAATHPVSRAIRRRLAGLAFLVVVGLLLASPS